MPRSSLLLSPLTFRSQVANSFATSVAAKSLSLRQACAIAAVCEFLGGVLVGAKVAGTSMSFLPSQMPLIVQAIPPPFSSLFSTLTQSIISLLLLLPSTVKNGIVNLAMFRANAGVEILAFVCALTASATWLMIATSALEPSPTVSSSFRALFTDTSSSLLFHLLENSWPVSTTYSIVSALAGVGVAVGGKDAVQWGWNDGKGLGAIFAGFILAPAIAAGFAGIVFLVTKYGILKRKNSTRAALIASPAYFFTGSFLLPVAFEQDRLGLG
jgi:sodium-dependent phosphate transporter